MAEGRHIASWVAAVQQGEEALARLSQGDPRRAELFDVLSQIQFAIYNFSKDISDLQRSMDTRRSAINEASAEKAKRILWLDELASRCLIKYRDHGNDIKSLLQGVEVTQEAIDAMGPHHEYYAATMDQMSKMELSVFVHTKDRLYLERSITSAQTSIATTPSGDSKMIDRKKYLADLLNNKVGLTQDTEDISQAIAAEESHIAEAPSGDVALYVRFDKLSRLFAARYEKSTNIDDLQQSVINADKSCENLPLNHVEKPSQLMKLGVRLHDRYEVLGSSQDMEKGLAVVEQAIGISSDAHKDWPDLISLRGSYMTSKYESTGEIKLLEDVVLAARLALGGTPVGDSRRHQKLSDLARALRNRFQVLGNREDLHEGILLLEQALKDVDDTHPNRVVLLVNLSMSLGIRFKMTGNRQDLWAAVARSCEAGVINVNSGKLTYRNIFLSNSINLCKQLYAVTSRIQHLEAGIRKAEELVKSTADGRVQYPENLDALADVLLLYYDRTKSLSHLERATTLATQASEKAVTGNSYLLKYLGRLSDCLSATFKKTGTSEALDAAVERARKALDSSPPDVWTLDGAAQKLVSLILTRFDLFGDQKDLQSAIQTSTEAITVLPDNHPRRPMWMYTLATAHARQYEISHASSDLLKATGRCQEALKLLPPNSAYRSAVLDTMGCLCYDVYGEAPLQKYLRDARNYSKEAVDSSREGDPFLALRLIHKATIHLKVWQDFQMDGELENAIACGSKALKIASSSDSYWLAVLNSLALIFREHYKSKGDDESLKKAIKYTEEALRGSPSHGLQRAQRLYNLSVLYTFRFDRHHDRLDLQCALDHYQQVIDCLGASPYIRIDAAVNCGRTLVGECRWEEAEVYFKKAVEFMAYAVPPSMGRTDQFFVLLGLRNIAVWACALALKNRKPPEEALNLLELGRGTILGYAMRDKLPNEELLAKHPDLFNRFQDVRNRLKTIPDSLMSETGFTLQTRKEVVPSHDMYQEFDQVLREIRQQKNFEHFWKPLSSDKYCALAGAGAIAVVICTEVGSYGLIINAHGAHSIALADLSEEEARCKLELFYAALEIPDPAGASNILRWLWKTAVGPILTFLGFEALPEGSSLPHMWWMGVGVMSRAPFHAAGDHRPKSTANTFSRIVSSYVTTLDALYQAKQKLSQSPRPSSVSSALVVSMPTTPGQESLKGVQKEVDMAQKILQTRMKVNHLVHPDAKTTLRRLPDQEIVHFACHGQRESIPFRSHLLLVKDEKLDELSMHDISLVDTKQGRLAYLSACRTAEGSVKGADEPLHLASAFQIAGFPHTVATLWPADDDVCQRVAEAFYTNLFSQEDLARRYEVVAVALHRAVLDARARNPKQPDLWAPFVHFGA
jgi:hypothetical protein